MNLSCIVYTSDSHLTRWFRGTRERPQRTNEAVHGLTADPSPHIIVVAVESRAGTLLPLVVSKTEKASSETAGMQA